MLIKSDLLALGSHAARLKDNRHLLNTMHVCSLPEYGASLHSEHHLMLETLSSF
jgi:hypothetical protein